MAIRFLVKRLATLNVSKTAGADVSGYVLRQFTTPIDRFSTVYKQPEGKENMRYRHYGSDSSNDKSITDHVTEKAKEGVKKATETAMNAGDNMKDTMDGAWKAAKETGQNIKDAVAEDEDDDDDDRIQHDTVAVVLQDVQQPVDTSEYRGVEELHQQNTDENKSP